MTDRPFPRTARSPDQQLVAPIKPSEHSDRVVAESLVLLERLGQALAQRQRAALVQTIDRLVEIAAPVGEQWRQLAELAANLGEVSISRKAIDLYVDACASTPLAKYHKAALLEQTGSLREAHSLLASLPLAEPSPAANAYSRGTSALFLGKIGEARSALSLAVKLDPMSGAAWLALATAYDLGAEPAIAQAVIAAPARLAGASQQQRAAAWYAAGKARADRAEHGEAFQAFARGAALAASLVTYDRAAAQAQADEALAGYEAGALQRLPRPSRVDTGRTIFVTGLPRSGTTLVEQILASHSAVVGGAEFERLPFLAQEIGGSDFPAVAAHFASHGSDAAAALWSHWLDERFGARGRVIDKSLTTSRHLGLAAAILPDAPLLWISRDPLDCAWSCFRTFFEARFLWSYDLRDIAFHFRIEDRLLAGWRTILGKRLLIVPYHQLVTEPSNWIGRILRHCGLPEEPQVFEPHLTDRPVTTASVMQVRRPISPAAIGAARPYEAWLTDFTSAYRG